MKNVERFRGHTIDNTYTIVNESPIGYGKDTVVYKGVDDRCRPSALKIFDPTKHDPSDIKAEAQIQARLHHPNILPFHWSGIARINNALNNRLVDGDFLPEPEYFPYIATQLANQGSLSLAMSQGEPLALEQAMAYAAEITSALDYAHREGEVHRDIKPANLLIHNESLLIADWGIAVPAHPDASDFTRQFPRGTSKYMAPEQTEGLANIHSDLYSMGVVLWETIAGQHPFNADSDVGYLIAHRQEAIPLFETVLGNKMNPTIEAIEPILVHAMEKDPKERALHFGSVAEFGAELTHTYSQATGKKSKTHIDLKTGATAVDIDTRLTTLFATKAQVIEDITEAREGLKRDKIQTEEEIVDRQKQTDETIAHRLRETDEQVAAKLVAAEAKGEEIILHATEEADTSQRQADAIIAKQLTQAEADIDQREFDAEAAIDKQIEAAKMRIKEADQHVAEQQHVAGILRASIADDEGRVEELGAQKTHLEAEVARLKREAAAVPSKPKREYPKLSDEISESVRRKREEEKEKYKYLDPIKNTLEREVESKIKDAKTLEEFYQGPNTWLIDNIFVREKIEDHGEKQYLKKALQAVMHKKREEIAAPIIERGLSQFDELITTELTIENYKDIFMQEKKLGPSLRSLQGYCDKETRKLIYETEEVLEGRLTTFITILDDTLMNIATPMQWTVEEKLRAVQTKNELDEWYDDEFLGIRKEWVQFAGLCLPNRSRVPLALTRAEAHLQDLYKRKKREV